MLEKVNKSPHLPPPKKKIKRYLRTVCHIIQCPKLHKALDWHWTSFDNFLMSCICFDQSKSKAMQEVRDGGGSGGEVNK